MKPLRASLLAALVVAAPAVFAADPDSHATKSGGYVDGAAFRALIDDTKDIVEVDLDGAILQALAALGGSDHDTPQSKALFAKLKSIHAVIGTIKGEAAPALAIVKQTDQKLVAAGWQRITRITEQTSTVTVLTHTVSDRVDGLVALIFDTKDNQLVFANLAGEIDVTQLAEYGKRLNVPGLDQFPAGH